MSDNLDRENQNASNKGVTEGLSSTGQEQDPTASEQPFPVVGIGASAGGLGALKQFFASVPRDSGLAFVVVVHLSPEHESRLAELLQPHIKIPVQQVSSSLALEKNNVYVIPPNANLDSIDTHLRLSKLEEARQERAPVDHFFRTLAKTHHQEAIGVVLTGTGSDGTLGLREIKERGGLVIVQDPNDAEFDGMPQSAISTGDIDLVLPLKEIVPAILEFVAMRPRVRLPINEDEVKESERQLLQSIFAQLRARTRRDFSDYKRSTVLRRIMRRMQFKRVQDLSAYLDVLRHDPTEALLLADDLLITVTGFFRDPDVFAKLKDVVIPELFDNRGDGGTIRIWVVGCATGEEAYSLAILLLEEAKRRDSDVLFQVFASDLHEASLGKAREGFYPGDIKTDVSPERIGRFFEKEDGGYRVREEVREQVVFAAHNVLTDPPFSHVDLICCRNLLIYLQRRIQADVIELFHYALKPSGHLVLGTSESVEGSDLFTIEDKSSCIFRRRNVQGPELRLPVFPLAGIRVPSDIESGHVRQPVSSGLLHQELVEELAPPSLLISPHHKALHFSASVGRFLVQPGGEPTMSVFDLVREELRIELHAAVTAARSQHTAIRSQPIAIQLDGKMRSVVLRVRPSVKPHYQGYLLVMFQEHDADPSEAETDRQDERQLQQGVAELTLTRRKLHTIIKKYETGQEDLRASNEELQSSNEELRSTLEELETSKEELQSTNEELQTVNQENRHKVEELSQLSSDLHNLLAATEIATLFLDRDFRILRFTPKINAIFNLRHADRGRPLTDLTHRLAYDRLQDDARKVLEHLTPIEREVPDDEGRWYLTRLLAYRSAEDRIEGVVITFFDITDRKHAEDALRGNEERYRLLVESATEYAIVMLDVKGSITTWSAGAERIFGYREDEVLGRPGAILFTAEDRASGVPVAEMEQAEQTGRAGDERWQLRKDGTRFWASGVMEALYSEADRSADCEGSSWAQGYVKVLRDNTERKRLEDDLRRAADELSKANRMKDEFLATMAHELRNPLAPIRTGLELMKAEDRDAQSLREIRDTMDRQVQQLVTIVDDLLDVSRVTRGTLQLRTQPVSIAEIMRNAAEATQPLIDEAGHRLEITMPTRPAFIEADPHRIVQVLSNLLNNAAKYTPESGLIRFTARRDDDAVVINVEDTGVGIPADKRDQVFDMFAQLDRPQERGDSGLGIGLTLAKSIVEMHNGRISVESEGAGCGTTFNVRFPLVDAGEADEEPVDPGEREDGNQRRHRVLVADDNVAAAQMLATLLGLDGHEVRTANNGREACELAEEFRPDLMLLDIGMPEMNGYEAAKHIRTQPWGNEVTLIAVTGWGNEDDKRKSKQAGFDHHLVKPIETSSIQPFLKG